MLVGRSASRFGAPSRQLAHAAPATAPSVALIGAPAQAIDIA
jgi:hypothetical protein